MPYLRFAQSGAIANGLIISDLVMPGGPGNSANFYIVRYVVNGSLLLA